MCLLIKFLFLLLVYHHVQELPVQGQLYSYPHPYKGDLKKLLRIPDTKFQMPHRINGFRPLEKLNSATDFLPIYNNKVLTTEKPTSTTFLPQIIKKDCSELNDLSCNKHRQLIESTDYSETTTSHSESDLSDRFFDPTLLALMLG